jgi:glycosyltransferase involved in cell wall biosynthesis
MTRGFRFLREFQPDLAHSHSFHANLATRLLKLCIPSLRVLSSVHNVYEGGWLRMLAYRLTDFLSCRTTAVSNAVADGFVAAKAIPMQKCIVILNGIELAEFSPSALRRAGMRTAMGVRQEFIWLTAGRMAPAKDYPNLLKAFRRVLQARPDARLWIAGEGGGREAAAIQILAAESGLGEAVLWLGLRRDINTLLDAADGFVLASAWEGMPLVVGEAMAMEKPVVATDVGGVRELTGSLGTIAVPRDSGALAQAMLETMERTEEDRRAVGRAARERIACDFSMDARADDWEALYRKLTARH